MKDKSTRHKLMTGRMISIGLGLAVAFWILDSIILDFISHHEGNFIEKMFSQEPHVILHRLLNLCLLVGIGIYGQVLVNKLKQAEEETNNTKQMLEEITHGITDRVLLVSKDFKIMWANRAVLEQYNCKLEEIVGEYCHKLTHQQESPCQPPHDVCPIQEIMETGKPVIVNHTHFDNSGNEFYAEVTAYPIKNEKGEIIQFVHLSRDVTERKRAEEALQQSEEKMRFILENAPNFITIVDRDATIQYINRTVPSMTKEEVIGKKLYEFTQPEYHDKYREILTQVFKTGKKSAIITTGAGPGGSDTWFDNRIAPIKHDKQIVAAEIISTDITKRMKAEEETNKTKQMLEEITHGITDGVLLLSRDFKIVWANRAILEQYNCKLEEIVGQYCHKLTHHQENPCEPPHDVCPIQEIIETGKPVIVNHTHFDNSGTAFYAEVTAYPIKNEKGEIIQFVHLSRDVTERKRAEEERLRMEQQVHLAGRLAAVGELAAGVAHELNNPLTAVQGYAQLLASRTDLDESIRSDVEAIWSEAKRASKTTSNLLSFARRHEPEKRLISINELVEKSLELHAYRLRVNNIEVSMELEPDLPFTMADFHQMQQVLVNLTTNAEQAMTEAHGKGKLCIKTQKVDEMIQITFTDDGPGIPEENLSRIFDSFFTTKEVGKGTGLGLSICRGIVQNHGGDISARSKPGEGATFVVEIPVISEEQAAAEQTGSSVEAQSAQS